MSSTVTVEPGFRGTISGLTRARFHQRATITITGAAGLKVAGTTLVGAGEDYPMAQESNAAQPVLSFGPSTEVLTIHVVIEHSEKPGGKFSPSKVIDPVTVRKEPDAYSPLTIIVSTILSEDNVDDDYNDCIVTILQYK